MSARTREVTDVPPDNRPKELPQSGPSAGGDEELTMLPVDLVLRDDDLAGVGVIGVGDGVAQDADHSDHLTHFGDPLGNVAGVTDELLASGDLSRRWPQVRGHMLGVGSFFREPHRSSCTKFDRLLKSSGSVCRTRSC